ncbi:TonB family protein [Herbaspirillum sp. LeCh32-8]|uniref:energy transducer TonB n=1 Tax=Herbaspirillum sp. LeCh32-8 TaxID=2821356 RepID=UPI001AE1A7E6|nr:TonB family protein [Herbaspirillum sp. LeCh32-8]MBP0598561.1 TonB family protein [Herbaspirillum sp. LeCh32-8]
MRAPFIFRFREPLAGLPSLVVLLALVLAGVQQTTRLMRHEDPKPVQIALFEEAPPAPKVQTPPPPEPPKKVEPPKPVVKPAPAPPPKPAPKNDPAPIEQVRPAPETPVMQTPQPAAHTAPPAPAPTPAPAPQPVAQPAPPPSTADIESQYVGKLRAHLNSIKRYPSGREVSQLRPKGTVRVWFVLKRDGSVVDVGIDASSNSMPLDDAARKTINRATFAGFPDGAFNGEATHRFTADLEFIPA